MWDVWKVRTCAAALRAVYIDDHAIQNRRSAEAKALMKTVAHQFKLFRSKAYIQQLNP